MRKTFLLISMLLFSIATFAQSLSPAATKKIEHIIRTFKKGDKKAIAALFQYPIQRASPLSSIKNQNEFVQKYDELVDEELIAQIEEQGIEAWTTMGDNYMFGEGNIWLNEDYKISTFSYSTAAGQDAQQRADAAERAKLPASLRTYEEHEFIIKTKTYLIRIDRMADNTVRYASWKLNKPHGEPDIIVYNGEVTGYSSSGNHTMVFKNKEYEYIVDIIYMGKSEKYDAALTVKKAGKTLLKHDGKIQKK